MPAVLSRVKFSQFPIGKVQTMDDAVTKDILMEPLITGETVPLIFITTVPAFTGIFRVGINFWSSAGETNTFSVGAADVFNLTTLGITDLTI